MKSTIVSRVLILCLAVVTSANTSLNADEVTKNQALTIAGKVVSQYFPADRQSAGASINISTALKTNEPFYVCNIGETGFVLVSKNDNAPPVLGFSWESKFPENLSGAPELMRSIIGSIRKQCEDYSLRDTVSLAIQESWKAYDSRKSSASLKTGVIFPLLKTIWNNDASFFELFPGNSKLGGMVPIAMGQVFRYYARPATGTGEFCYVLKGTGEICTNFELARLNFAGMSDTQGNPSVDSLMYYMAVTASMQADGASLHSYVSTLPTHFGYSPDMRMVEGWDYNIGDLVRHQLSLKNPVPAEWIGHSFVLDGYAPDNLFHFNMGWGGEYNGFYPVDYPVVEVDTDHSLFKCYIDFHPKSALPTPTNLTAHAEGDGVRVSWDSNLNDSLQALLVRFVVLQDGLMPIAETNQTSILISAETLAGSAELRVITDLGANGSSEMSQRFRYISNMELADIQSLALRSIINTQVGRTDLLRQPYVGELDLIRNLEINFPDQRGIEKLPNLASLRIDGAYMTSLRDGEYLERLRVLRFYNCDEFDMSIFGHTHSLLQIFGYDNLPVDMYDFRHNADLGLTQLLTTATNPNGLMDLYGVDKYFPKAADFYLFHNSGGPGAAFENCFVSKESYYDVYPKIKSNFNLMLRTKPTTFAPCYPTPARNVNLPEVSRLSWQANMEDNPGVYYNVYIGNNRAHLELVSVFQTNRYFDGSFEPDMEYYWRVEAFHSDSTYYSGIYHFSTWQDLPIPYVERFDDFYNAASILDESPFWISMDHTLTGKAVTNRNTSFGGHYSLELKPKSDAAVLIGSPDKPNYFVEFRLWNQGGQFSTELLQMSGSSNDTIVNAKIDFHADGTGLFSYETTTFPFAYVLGKFNRINLSVNSTTGRASFMVNEGLIREWQWNVQMGGTANSNPFKGVRLVNNAATAGESAFVDNFIIDLENPASISVAVNPEIGLVWMPASREVVVSGIEAGVIREITLYDLQGRKMMGRENPANLVFPVGREIRNGIYLVVVSPKNGLPYSQKIAILD